MQKTFKSPHDEWIKELPLDELLKAIHRYEKANTHTAKWWLSLYYKEMDRRFPVPEQEGIER